MTRWKKFRPLISPFICFTGAGLRLRGSSQRSCRKHTWYMLFFVNKKNEKNWFELPPVTSNYCFQHNCGQSGADLQRPLPCNFVQDPANFVTGIVAPGAVMGLVSHLWNPAKKREARGYSYTEEQSQIERIAKYLPAISRCSPYSI